VLDRTPTPHAMVRVVVGHASGFSRRAPLPRRHTNRSRDVAQRMDSEAADRPQQYRPGSPAPDDLLHNGPGSIASGAGAGITRKSRQGSADSSRTPRLEGDDFCHNDGLRKSLSSIIHVPHENPERLGGGAKPRRVLPDAADCRQGHQP